MVGFCSDVFFRAENSVVLTYELFEALFVFSYLPTTDD